MRPLLLSLAAILLLTSTARAQDDKRPIGRFAIDFRGFYSGLGQDPITAAGLNVDKATLPTRALGGVTGVHLSWGPCGFREAGSPTATRARRAGGLQLRASGFSSVWRASVQRVSSVDRACDGHP